MILAWGHGWARLAQNIPPSKTVAGQKLKWILCFADILDESLHIFALHYYSRAAWISVLVFSYIESDRGNCSAEENLSW